MKYFDLQVNGYRGVNFSDSGLTLGDFARAAGELIEAGSGFLPTIVTCPLPVYRRNLPLIGSMIDNNAFGDAVPGIHLEGPFISREPGAVGAHPAEYVRDPDIALFDEFYELSKGTVRMLTVAPEAPGAEELIAHAAALGVTVGLGHTLALEDELAAAVRAGARIFTHLGNGLPAMIPRHPNTIWAALAQDGLAVTIITDGHHLPVSFIKTVLRAKGPDAVAVVSDATHLSGMPPGRYEGFDGEVILEESGRLHSPAKGCLAGSSAIMADCARFLLREGLAGEDQIERLCRKNPLAFVGLSAPVR